MAATDRTPTPNLSEEATQAGTKPQIDTDRERIERARRISHVFVGKTRLDTGGQPNFVRDTVERAARELLIKAG